jgi:hypothetical protein
MGDGIMGLLMAALVTVCIAVPLAVWKLIDIVIWVFSHFEVTWK